MVYPFLLLTAGKYGYLIPPRRVCKPLCCQRFPQKKPLMPSHLPSLECLSRVFRPWSSHHIPTLWLVSVIPLDYSHFPTFDISYIILPLVCIPPLVTSYLSS